MIYFLKLNMGLYLRATCQVSSIMLASFRRGKGGGVILGGPLPPPPTTASKRTSKKATQIRVKVLNSFEISTDSTFLF